MECNDATFWEKDRMAKFVSEALHNAAEIYEERNKLYGDNYKRFGNVMEALMPSGMEQGFPETKAQFNNRVGVLIQVISKLTRYCENFNSGGHDDSLDDLAVYAMMLKELDTEARRL